jgi:hypothetical protein
VIIVIVCVSVAACGACIFYFVCKRRQQPHVIAYNYGQPAYAGKDRD